MHLGLQEWAVQGNASQLHQLGPPYQQRSTNAGVTLLQSWVHPTTMVDPSVHPCPSTTEPFDAIDLSNYSSTARRTLSLTDFKLNAIEQSSLDTLQTDLFHSIVLRAFDSSLSFPAIPSLINCIRKQAADKEVSNVTYVEVVSEKADSKPTLIGVISRLQKVFVQELGQKYVGDAKTYNILQEIRYECKSQLKWLFPFPGDWHVLYNFQKVLMKPYADAGLVSLGKASGHRAGTLTSLVQASNFWRTHEFLLQAYEAIYRFFLSLNVASISEPEKEIKPEETKGQTDRTGEKDRPEISQTTVSLDL